MPMPKTPVKGFSNVCLGADATENMDPSIGEARDQDRRKSSEGTEVSLGERAGEEERCACCNLTCCRLTCLIVDLGVTATANLGTQLTHLGAGP